ncbi:MAG: protein O-mannosyl-transferase family, partial [Microgenomates group bacterium]
DSTEYLTSVITLSIPHPPGYPLYTLLGIGATKILWFLKPILVLGLLNIVFFLLFIFFLFKLFSLLKIEKKILFFSFLYFSFIFPVLLYNLVPEVFALNLLILVLIVYNGFSFIKTNNYKYLSFFYLTCALGLANHHSFIFFTLPFLILDRRFINKRILFIFLFLIFYFYPVLASLNNPPIDWENSKSISGLIRLFTRSSYGTFTAYYGSSPNLINQLTILLSTVIFVIGDYKPFGVFLILLGFFYLRKKERLLWQYLLITTFLYLFFLYLTNFDLSKTFSLATFERFLIAFYLILFFFFVYGAHYMLKFLMTILKNHEKKIINIILIFFTFSILIVHSYPTINIMFTFKNTNYFYNFSNTLLNIPEKNSILLLKSDITYFPVAYQYYVEKKRNDLIFVFPPMFQRDYYLEKVKKKYPQLILKQSLSTEDFIKNNKKKYRIYSENPYPYGFYIPYGLLWKFYDSQTQIKKDLNKIIYFNQNFWLNDLPIFSIEEKLNKILFLKSLKEFYQEKLFFYIRFLYDNNQYSTLNIFLNLLHKKYDIKNLNYLSNLIDSYLGVEFCEKLSWQNKKNYCL